MSQHSLQFNLKAFGNGLNQTFDQVINKIKTTGAEIQKVNSVITTTSNGRQYQRLYLTYTDGMKKISEVYNGAGNVIKQSQTLINKGFDYGKLMWMLNWAKGFARSLWNIEQYAIDFQETQEKFSVSMGSAKEDALKFNKQITDATHFSTATLMDYQSNYRNILNGLGDFTDDKAEKISETLTKMSLDYSSLFNISEKSAANKFQAALTGSIMPIRRESGFDVSKNAVTNKLADLGIDKTYNNLTEVEKRLVRIMLLMDQMKNTGAFNDLARTIESPSNQLKVLNAQMQELKLWLGELFRGLVSNILPVINGIVMAIKEMVKSLALLLNKGKVDSNLTDPLKESDGYISTISDGVGDVGSGIDKANKKAKEFKKTLQGFDVLNVINTPTQSDTTNPKGTGTSGIGTGIDPDIAKAFEQYQYEMGKISMKADKIKNKILKWKKYIIDIAAITAGGLGFILIAKQVEKIAKFLKVFKISKISAGGLSNFLTAIGLLGGAFKNLLDIKNDIIDILQNGPNFNNVVNLISSSFGALGKIEILRGHSKIGGIIEAFEGVGKIVQAVKNLADAIKEKDIDKAKDAVITGIDGLGAILIAIGALKGKAGVLATGFTLQGLTGIISELQKNWDAIKQGDWSGVDKVYLAESAIEILGGVAYPKITDAIKNIGEKKPKSEDTEKAKEAMQQSSDALKDTSNKTTEISSGAESLSGNTSTLTGKLKDLVKNMGLGLVAELEAVAAGLILVGGIWAIGAMLTKMVEAWKPILDNKKQTLETLGLGAAFIGIVGTVVGALGSVGGALVAALGIGTAVLALAEADTLLLVGGIWLIGVALDKMQKAWQPVIKNQDNVTEALKKGTELLFAVGLATAALGALSIASVGLLPLAIAAGTAMLNQVTNATIQFVRNLAKVADELLNVLLPKLRDFNRQMPALNHYQSDFNNYMGKFAGFSWNFAGNTLISGLGNAVTSIVRIFTGDPIKRYARQVEKTDDSVGYLKDRLWNANHDLVLAIRYLTDYNNLVNWLSSLVGSSVSFRDARGIYINLKSVGSNIVWGLTDGINDNIWQFRNAMRSITDSLNFNDSGAYWDGYDFGRSIANGINNGVKRNLKTTIKLIDTSNWHTSKQYKIEAYGNGGFPDMGQMFVARERGPELVGSINNRTAVANNDQIVQAVSQGVANAVSKVLGTQGGSYNLYIDGEQITNVVQKRTSSRENIFGY